jgi:hypothetical protein
VESVLTVSSPLAAPTLQQAGYVSAAACELLRAVKLTVETLIFSAGAFAGRDSAKACLRFIQAWNRHASHFFALDSVNAAYC